MKANQLVESTRFLAVACRLGQPLADALKLLEEEELAEAQAGGDTLSEALSKQPQRFGTFYRAVVQTAEESPNPGEVLERLSDWLELKARLDQRLATALYYPLLIFDIAVIQVVFFLGFIFPQLLVPMMQAGHLSTPDPLALQGLAAVIAVITVGLHFWPRVREGIFSCIPWLAKARFKAEQGLWLRGLSTLTAGGLPLPEALDRANKSLAEGSRLRRLAGLVKAGSSLADAAAQIPGLDPVTVSALSSDHELANNLLLAARIVESEIDNLAEKSERVAQPLALIALGVPVAVAVLLFWSPFFSSMMLLAEKT